MEKRNIQFHDVNHVTFTPVSTLYFEPSLSNGTEKDKITFLNIPAVVSLYFEAINVINTKLKQKFISIERV